MHLFFEIIARLGQLIEPIPAPGIVDWIPVIKAYFGIFASAPVFLVSFALYLLALSLAAVAALIGVYFGIAVTRALIALALLLIIGIIYGLSKTTILAPRLIALNKIGEGVRFKRKYGAKAINLGRLIRAGFHVPDGYALAGAPESSASKSLNRLAKKIGKLFGQGTIIIRSSFSGEDSKHASYSGVFLSVKSVNPNNSDALVNSIGRVSASKSNAALIDSQDMPGEGISIVFQNQIPHRLSGFAFSVDVSTGRAECLLIEVQEGGRATYRIDRITGARRCILGEPETLSEDLQDRIIEATGKAIDLFKAPTQIEWGYDGNTLWIYQARPILKIPPLDTWIVAPGLESTKALTPMSKGVLFFDNASGISGGTFARLGIISGDYFRDYEGRRFLDWNALEAARRKLRKGDLSPKIFYQLLKLFLCAKGRTTFSEKVSLKDLAKALHEEIRAQQDDRLVIDALCVVGSFLCGGLISPGQLKNLYPMGKDNPFIEMGRDLKHLIKSEGLDAAVNKYPFLTLYESELAAMRAVDDPKIVDSFIISDPLSGESHEEKREVLNELQRAQRSALVRWLPLIASRIGRAVRRRRIDAEARHLNILKINHAIRQRVLKQAAEANIVAEDAFFFSAEELTGGAEAYPSEEIVRKRRSRYFELMAETTVNVLHYRGDERITFEFEVNESDSLRGVGIGHGTYRGMLIDPKDSADIEADAIALFHDTSARRLGDLRPSRPVLCLTGGILSHLANVAREIGVPIFVLTEASSESFRFGNEVEIDFDRGMVRLV